MNNLKIGIDKIDYFTSDLYLDLRELAIARNEDPDKYTIGIGQDYQSVIPNSQDAVTLAANAAIKIVDEYEQQKIDLILFATESGVDNSKSAAIYLQRLLNINSNAKGIELKEACYGSTAALQLALGHISLHPESRVLIVGSDIARYGLRTPGEVTQGGGAVAMIVSSNPRILEIRPESAHITEDVMDFWRPLYKTNALVDGKYSSENYLNFFERTFTAYLNDQKLKISDLDSIIFHLPYTKQGLKALKLVLDKTDLDTKNRFLTRFEDSTILARKIGNIYTGSLYLSLISLLAKFEMDIGSRIGLYGYGSGAEGEFFTGIIQEKYTDMISTNMYKRLNRRIKCSVNEYEKIYKSHNSLISEDFETNFKDDHSRFILSGQQNKQRIYIDRNKTN